jgi:hypothetical protein
MGSLALQSHFYRLYSNKTNLKPLEACTINIVMLLDCNGLQCTFMVVF